MELRAILIPLSNPGMKIAGAESLADIATLYLRYFGKVIGYPQLESLRTEVPAKSVGVWRYSTPIFSNIIPR